MSDEVQPGGSSSSMSPASPRPARPGFRLFQVLANELEGLHFRFRLVNLLGLFLPHFALNRLRTLLYRLAGVKIGPRSLILGPIEVVGPGAIQERFSTGSDCQVNSPLYLDVAASIRLGNGVYVGHHVVFVTTDHAIGPAWRRCGGWRCAPIVVEDGVWIAARVTVLPGVTIGKGAVIASGAVVIRDVPPNTLTGGVPAKVIRELDEHEQTGA